MKLYAFYLTCCASRGAEGLIRADSEKEGFKEESDPHIYAGSLYIDEKCSCKYCRDEVLFAFVLEYFNMTRDYILNLYKEKLSNAKEICSK